MDSQTKRVTNGFINSLRFGEQDGILGWYFYERDPINVAGAELRGAKFFLVWNMCLA